MDLQASARWAATVNCARQPQAKKSVSDSLSFMGDNYTPAAIDTRYHALCEWVERDLIKLERVDTSKNMADHFTKQLTPTLFNRHVDYILGKVPPHYSVRHKNITELITHVTPRTVKKKELPNPASTTPPTSALPNTSEANATTLVCAKLYATWFNIISRI